nr:(2Fe-2S)-binding protein [Streptomyces sp. NBC_00995]
MYVCSCFGVTEQQVKKHAEDGACTPRQIASACKAGTDCGSCVRTIQAMLGRGSCPPRDVLGRKPAPGTADRATGGAAPGADERIAPGPVLVPAAFPDAA